MALLNAHADPLLGTVLGQTPLHAAADSGYLEIVRLLLHLGAEPTQENQFGNTPLHGASMWTHLEVIQALIQAGARVDAQNEYGLTPYSIAHDDACKRVLEAERERANGESGGVRRDHMMGRTVRRDHTMGV